MIQYCLNGVLWISGRVLCLRLKGHWFETYPSHCVVPSALDKLFGQLGIYATWLSSFAYLQKQLRIFIFFYATFSSVITPFLIA